MERTVKIKDDKSKTRRSKTQLVERKEHVTRARSDKWDLRLSVAGQTPKAVTVPNNLK